MTIEHARRWLTIGAVCGFATVALGAFGAHALADRVEPSLIANWATATDYLGLHALAILGCGLWCLVVSDARHEASASLGWVSKAALAFLIGILLFCGSLYLMVLTGNRALGMITPMGGVAMLIGWAFLILAAWRARVLV